MAKSSALFEAELGRIADTFTELLALRPPEFPKFEEGQEDLGENALGGYIDYVTPLHEEILEAMKEIRLLDKSWKTYISSLPSLKDRTDEEGNYQQAGVNVDLPTKLPAMKKHLREIGQLITDAKTQKARCSILLRRAAGTTAPPATAPVGFSIKAPQMHLQPFNGDIRDFPRFWNAFIDLYDRAPSLTPQQKMHLLVTHVDKNIEAYDFLSALAPVDASYQKAKDYMIKHFDKPAMIKDQIRTELFSL